MTGFLGKLGAFTGAHWPWLTGGAILAVALILIMVFGARSPAAGSRLLAPWRWYAAHRGARRFTVNALGVALVIWFAQTFALWVQPSLTPDMLFTPPVVGPQGVDVAMVEQRRLEDTVTYTGAVQPDEDVVLYARVNGFVKALKVYPGDRVKKGEVLATLETSELEPELEHARAELSFREAEFKRDQGLFQSGVISASAFDDSRRQYEIARAKVKLQETLIGYATLRAPMDGVVSERQVYPGDFVKKGTPLLKIDRLDTVRIQFQVAEKDLSWFKPGTTVYLRFPQLPPERIRATFADLVVAANGDTEVKTDELPRLKTEIAAVFPAEDPKTRTGTVEVRLPNPGGLLKTDSYATGELVRRQVDDALVVPATALTPMPEGKPVVYVGPAFSDEGGAERREVRIGLRTDDYVQILEGVKPGEAVITRGNRVVTDGQTVRVVRRTGGGTF